MTDSTMLALATMNLKRIGPIPGPDDTQSDAD